MKVLVTGGAGFMGSHVVDELIRRGAEVVVLDDLSGGFRDNVNPQAAFVKGCVTDEDLVADLFRRHRFEYVFHLAAYAAEGLSHFIRRFNYTNNLIGGVNLINESVRYDVRCLVFTSSIAVYGNNRLPMTEDLEPHPEDPYGIAKYAVEMDLQAAHAMFGLDYVIFRPHNVYGERQNIGDRYRNVLGIFMNQIMQDRPMTIFGDGEQTRAFSYIRDVAPIMVEAAFRPDCYNEVFNVGSDKPYTVNRLAQIIAEAFGVPCRVEHVPERLEVKHAYCSHQKIRNWLGFHAETPLEEGVRRMVEWARRAGPRQSREFGRLEISKNLPGVWRTGYLTRNVSGSTARG